MGDERSVFLGGERVSYGIRVSDKAKRARILVGASGVVVVLPRGVSKERASGLLQRHSEWLLKQLEWVRSLHEQLRARGLGKENILFRGAELPVRIVEEAYGRHSLPVEQVNGKLEIRVQRGGTLSPAQMLEAWLRNHARLDFQVCVMARSLEMGQKAGRVSILGQRTKWGACSGRGNLTFNWRLVMAPRAVLDYVVVHELAHLSEPNHSGKFWRLVRSYCPEFDGHKEWLRKNQELLYAPLLSNAGSRLLR
jgi:predicted metal-dependent hydrolase